MKSFITRSLPKVRPLHAILIGIGSMLAIGIVAFLSSATSIPWLMAPLGASCVLLFAAPASPLAQPINVVAGHFVCTCVGLLFHSIFAGEWWYMAASVGVSIALMTALRITHPPAGADPIIVFWSNPGWEYLVFPVLVGSVVLVTVATCYHAVTGTSDYPAKNH